MVFILVNIATISNMYSIELWPAINVMDPCESTAIKAYIISILLTTYKFITKCTTMSQQNICPFKQSYNTDSSTELISVLVK
jgi:hypothetical protein